MKGKTIVKTTGRKRKKERREGKGRGTERGQRYVGFYVSPGVFQVCPGRCVAMETQVDAAR